ncbi:MAG: ABC transporter ATP-binding protein [Marinilabiliaceae bacterium]|nr:ABC transporter ATP-binding protein [Marinilabiliaceae bacterium]
MESNVITIRGLKKSFGRGNQTNEVLKGIDLDIPKGQIIGYIGPNGAGKSTTVKILCGIIKEYEGEIEVLGKCLTNESDAIKARIGYVPENGAMYDVLTPREYLKLIGALYGIEEQQLNTRIQHLVSFFEMTTHADQRMDTFSKGMRQKILIVAGLLNNPDILFLDEPLSGLDANAVIMVKEMLTRLAAQGKTIFYCSHLMDVVEKISDRIILINDGQVITDGTFAELKTEKADTLERLFADLTGGSKESVNTEALLDAFNQN